MQAAIDIPRPLSADNETVITALETAELFSAKGDTHEAVRWLRRAAESAGEAGDDARALALSRKAADLHEALEANPPPSSAPRLSAAPASVPRPSAVPASVPRPSAAPTSATAASPPPPSARVSKPPPLPPPLPSQPEASAASASPLPPQLLGAPPLPSQPAAGAAPSLPTPSTPPVTPRPSYPPPPSSRPGFHPPVSRPPLAQALPPPTSTSTVAAAPTPAPNGERHASRVSVTRSPTQHGVYEMRLLADGEPAPSDGSEGFLVMLDKNSTLLSS
jgi:hypothetical protein